jgi:hypothetical protein
MRGCILSWQRVLLLIWFVCGVACGEEVTHADIIFRHGQPPHRGRVLGLEQDLLRFEMEVLPGRPPASVTLSRRHIERIDLADEQAVLEKVSKADQILLEQLWDKQRPLLDLPRSYAGEVGLTLAERCMQQEKRDSARKALEIYRAIEEKDWEPSRRARARRGRLRAMVAVGAAAEAIEEATVLANESEDPEVLIEARYVLAQASAAKFRELLREHPRWMEDERVRPERNRLYHETLDLFLYAYLFHGTHAGQAARGLWGALEIYQLCGEEEAARRIAADLVFFYPETHEGKRAQELLSQKEKKDH